jgi:hypothetical protein
VYDKVIDVTVTVSDQDDQPVDGATVSINRVIQGLTPAHFQYEFYREVPYLITVDKTGYLPASAWLPGDRAPCDRIADHIARITTELSHVQEQLINVDNSDLDLPRKAQTLGQDLSNLQAIRAHYCP